MKERRIFRDILAVISNLFSKESIMTTEVTETKDSQPTPTVVVSEEARPTVEVNEEAPAVTLVQALPAAMAAFLAKVGALNTARGGVVAAVDSKVAAQAQLEAAQLGENDARQSVADTSREAMSFRDEVVSILQSWTP